MKILIIRHADPDYINDTITEKGWREAKLLAERIAKLDIKAFYLSPLGRAQDTASLTLKKMNRKGETKDWLREFHAPISIDNQKDKIAWDLLPAFWTPQNEMYHIDTWTEAPVYKESTAFDESHRVYTGLDEILANHGYKRKDNYYQVTSANRDTIAFFCHFGVECVMLGHLLGISPVLLWHGFCAAPTSVTTIYTEERQEGIAYFRASSLADTSHLYAAGEEIAFSGRFCETFDSDERH